MTESLAPMIPIFDGHNDTLLALSPARPGGGRSFLVRNAEGHLDLPRAREGGLAGGMFAVFVPSNPKTPDALEMSPLRDSAYAQRFTISVVAGLIRLEAQSGGRIKVVRTIGELDACLRRNILAVVLHFEGAEAIDPALDALYVFYEAGLRSLGVVWSRPNAFGHGVPFKFPSSPDTGPGLTDAGRELVRACNGLGVLVDLAHMNERGFWDVAGLSEAPLVVTHAAVHALCPSARNLTDKQLDAIGESGGVVGITFYVGDLRADGRKDADTPVTEIVRHIEYVADRIGIGHVAIGSDFDGALIPREVGDVTGLPRLIAALRDRGYDDAALRKLAHENWVRVLRETWRDG
jgi:membrane dipeptidase